MAFPPLPWVLFGITSLFLLISLYYNWKFAITIIKVEDEVGDCLEILDLKYQSISKVLQIPIFFDSPQVRQVIGDIRDARDSILIIANKIASIEEDQIGKDEKNS